MHRGTLPDLPRDNLASVIAYSKTKDIVTMASELISAVTFLSHSNLFATIDTLTIALEVVNDSHSRHHIRSLPL